MKLTIVGAGGRFTQRILSAVTNRPEFADTTVVLYDRDSERAALAERWGRRLVTDREAAVDVTTAASLESAVSAADFVFTTLRVGGGEAYQADLEVPARYGIEQGVGDTVGPGGFFAALRQIPAIVAVAKAIAEHSPNAYLLNFSNPMTAICTAVTRETAVQCVGLCHGIHSQHAWFARYLDVPPENLTLSVGGVNHCSWVTDLRLNGSDAFPVLRRHRQEHGPDDQPIAFQLFDIFGQFPCPGDRHVAEFFPYFHRADADGGRSYGLKTSVDQLAREQNRRDTSWTRLSQEADGTAQISARPIGQDQREVDLIAALSGLAVSGAEPEADDSPLFAVNVPNRGGVIPELRHDAVVEVLATADSDGLHPQPPGALTPGVAANLRARLDQIELTVQAALSGDRELAFQALVADPLVPSLEHARGLFDELFARQASHLPQFG